MIEETRQDYPLAESQGDSLKGPRGRVLDDITLEAVERGEAGIEDLRITREALLAQARVARDAGRAALAQNFERGAELVDVPQDVIMETYEMLRPGRVETRSALTDQAAMLRRQHGAELIADFVERAAEIYVRRGLLREG